MPPPASHRRTAAFSLRKRGHAAEKAFLSARHRPPPREKRQEIGSPSKHGSIFPAANIGQAANERLLPALNGPEATNHGRPLVSARTAALVTTQWRPPRAPQLAERLQMIM
ncbi:hypothetical protein TRIATDRAFT_308921 [Trichoderma atroviride IMI 206040]|uniref:Uncharacterized protein n=2 Tax=Hypocrea atroviridis TaxID=63577 RepID=G9NWN3_HYPAI|nr:uncharacterized protein TRIATDRAFT_308921 [Trichoderma atroviride IMI 206040]EHK45386.1 hypothetical protein TRIATDRAFT_308921 [Trichoderma atroviride IMI 206040]